MKNSQNSNRKIIKKCFLYLTEDRNRSIDFFPNRDEPFTLLLSDGTEKSAKVCQRAL